MRPFVSHCTRADTEGAIGEERAENDRQYEDIRSELVLDRGPREVFVPRLTGFSASRKLRRRMRIAKRKTQMMTSYRRRTKRLRQKRTTRSTFNQKLALRRFVLLRRRMARSRYQYRKDYHPRQRSF